MKINSIALLVACLWVANAEAQSGLETILTDISKNNKTLQSQSKYWEAQNCNSKTGNTLYDPTISYDYMRGTPSAVAGNQTDISVIQRFDFPTVYGKKKNLANEKSKQGDFALLATKQDILLEAKKSAIELIYRNKLQEKIKERKTKTEKFLSDFQTKLNRGEGNILDVNKAKLQLIEINKDLKLNTSSINQLQQKLTELNGGIDVIFNESEYPEVIAIPSFEELEEIIEAQDPTRKLLQQQTTIAQQQIQVTKAMALPKFEAGYHYQGILGQNFHGARIGMSIPLWENKNRVKQSMAELEMNEVQLNEHKVEHYYNIKSLYEKYTNLQKTLDEYQTVLESINSIQLLDKALRFGEITTIQYFLEASYYYQASNNYLLTEKEYQDVIAELLKYQL